MPRSCREARASSRRLIQLSLMSSSMAAMPVRARMAARTESPTRLPLPAWMWVAAGVAVGVEPPPSLASSWVCACSALMFMSARHACSRSPWAAANGWNTALMAARRVFSSAIS
ncbi:hypothetical protein D9M71_558490 [compost metagenome]